MRERIKILRNGAMRDCAPRGKSIQAGPRQIGPYFLVSKSDKAHLSVLDAGNGQKLIETGLNAIQDQCLSTAIFVWSEITSSQRFIQFLQLWGGIVVQQAIQADVDVKGRHGTSDSHQALYIPQHHVSVGA